MYANITTLAKHKEFFMTEIDFKTYLEGIKNDLKITIDDIFAVIEKLFDEIQEIKNKN